MKANMGMRRPYWRGRRSGANSISSGRSRLERKQGSTPSRLRQGLKFWAEAEKRPHALGQRCTRWTPGRAHWNSRHSPISWKLIA